MVTRDWIRNKNELLYALYQLEYECNVADKSEDLKKYADELNTIITKLEIGLYPWRGYW